MIVHVDWTGGTSYTAQIPSQGSLTFDSEAGPTPMEALLCSLAACTAMDVVSILEKMRQVVTDYRVEAKGERPPKGTFPRPFTSIAVKHILTGVDLDPLAVERAVRLSEDKYCSVSQTLAKGVEITSEWTILQSP